MEGGAPTALSYFLSSDIQLKVKLHVLTIHGTQSRSPCDRQPAA